MGGTVKGFVKMLVPAGLREWLRALFGWQGFEGNYRTWAEAAAVCRGYDDAVIVERVLATTLAVKAGRWVFERDGVAFAEATPEPGLVAALRTVVAGTGPRLRVLDFGGALGTTYWRHRAEFGGMGAWVWDVVEQRGFVAAGRAQLADTGLRFFETVEAAEAAGAHDVLMASTSLQYLAEPHETVDRWMAREFAWLLFNNLPLHADAPDRIAVQRVPAEIYPGSYPVWFFNRERFLARFEGRYDMVLEFPGEAVWRVGARRYPSTGLLLRRSETR